MWWRAGMKMNVEGRRWTWKKKFKLSMKDIAFHVSPGCLESMAELITMGKMEMRLVHATSSGA
jgi:hypothetical protein